NGTPPNTPGAGTADPVMSPESGILDEATGTITFESIEVPDFKNTAHRKALYASRQGKLIRRANFTRGKATGQRELWKDGLGADTGPIVDKLTKRYQKEFPAPGHEPPATYIFKSPDKGQPRYFVGDLPTIAKEMTLP